jgi:phycocyanin-associated, rod
MSGMTTTGATSLSSHNNRTIAIEVSGHGPQETSRTSNYVIKIPYSRLSATLQSIGRSGAKILSVTLNGQPAPSQAHIEATPIDATPIEPGSPTIANPIATSPTIASPITTNRPAVTHPAAQPVAHGHGFQTNTDPKKSKKRKR